MLLLLPTLGLAICGSSCNAWNPLKPAPPDWTPPPLPVRGISAHRGAQSTHPENTLAAFREAIRLGVQQIEFDVRATADSQLVIMHDSTVDRTTNGHGSVSHLTLEQIRRLDAGSWKSPRFRGERVPTLLETVRIMPRNIWLNVHVKGEPWVAAEVVTLLIDENRLDQAFVSVGEEGARAAREVHPGVMICDLERKLTRRQYMQHALESRANFIQLHDSRGLPEAEDVATLRRSGLFVNYCCVDDPTHLFGLFALGVNFPLVDDAAGAMQAVRRLGIEPTLPSYEKSELP